MQQSKKTTDLEELLKAIEDDEDKGAIGDDMDEDDDPIEEDEDEGAIEDDEES